MYAALDMSSTTVLSGVLGWYVLWYSRAAPAYKTLSAENTHVAINQQEKYTPAIDDIRSCW